MIASPAQLLNPDDLLTLVRASSHTVLLLDYDGTLVPFKDIPDQASPDADLLGLLASLCERPDYRLNIVTGRTRVQVAKWFGALPLGLYAEHGVWCKPSGHDVWHRAVEQVHAWPPDIIDALKRASGMLPGSLLEVKSASLVFHFRAVRRDWVATTVPWLRSRLDSLAQQHSFRLVPGDEVLELRAPGVSKAVAVAMIQQRLPQGATFVAFGDDVTDEEMFRALPSDAVTVHVGSGSSIARYRVDGPEQVRLLLAKLK